MEQKPKPFRPDTLHVTRDGELDINYELKRRSLNVARTFGFIAYKGVLALDDAIMRSHGVKQ